MRWWIAAVLIALLALPVLLHPSSHVWGLAWVDGYGTQWFYWFVEEVFAGRQDAAHSNLLFYPWGKDVYLHTGGNLLDAFIAMPLRKVFGPILGYNLWMMAILFGNFYGGTVLAASLEMPVARRWVAGLALILNPYVLNEMSYGRPTQAFLLFPALAAAGFWQGRPRWWLAIGLGVSVALSAFQYWYYGILVGALGAVYGLLRMLRGPDRLQWLMYYGLAAGVTLAVVMPAAVPMLEALGEGRVPGLVALDGDGILAPLSMHTREGDNLGFFILTLSGGAGSLIGEGGLRYDPENQMLPYLWPIWLAFGLWSVPRGWGLALWVGLALGVALGPAWVLGTDIHANALYLFLLSHVAPLQRWWWPGRAVLGIWLVLAAVAPAIVWGRYRFQPWLIGGLWAGSTVYTLWGTILPTPYWEASDSTVVQCLQGLPEGAVLDLPYLLRQENLYLQTIHHKPIMGGMLVRGAGFGSAEVNAWIDRNALLANLVAIGDQNWAIHPEILPHDFEEMSSLGYRYLLVHTYGIIRPKQRKGTVVWESDWDRAQRVLVGIFHRGPDASDSRFALWGLLEPIKCDEGGVEGAGDYPKDP